MDTPYATYVEGRVHSTQDFARTLFEAGDGRPVLAIAHHQDAGRGRSDNPWWSSPRATLASLAVECPHVPLITLIPLVAGLAAHDAIASELGISTTLKWPNDVMLGGAKVGGILAERSDDSLVVGCGINLWWPQAPVGAVALQESDPGEAVAESLAHAWAGRLLHGLDGLPGSFEKGRYVEVCSTIGRDITWRPGGAGRAVGISSDGALIVETTAGQRTLRSGEVSHVRPATMPPDDSAQ